MTALVAVILLRSVRELEGEGGGAAWRRGSDAFHEETPCVARHPGSGLVADAFFGRQAPAHGRGFAGQRAHAPWFTSGSLPPVTEPSGRDTPSSPRNASGLAPRPSAGGADRARRQAKKNGLDAEASNPMNSF